MSFTACPGTGKGAVPMKLVIHIWGPRRPYPPLQAANSSVQWSVHIPTVCTYLSPLGALLQKAYLIYNGQARTAQASGACWYRHRRENNHQRPLTCSAGQKSTQLLLKDVHSTQLPTCTQAAHKKKGETWRRENVLYMPPFPGKKVKWTHTPARAESKFKSEHRQYRVSAACALRVLTTFQWEASC